MYQQEMILLRWTLTRWKFGRKLSFVMTTSHCITRCEKLSFLQRACRFTKKTKFSMKLHWLTARCHFFVGVKSLMDLFCPKGVKSASWSACWFHCESALLTHILTLYRKIFMIQVCESAKLTHSEISFADFTKLVKSESWSACWFHCESALLTHNLMIQKIFSDKWVRWTLTPFGQKRSIKLFTPTSC